MDSRCGTQDGKMVIGFYVLLICLSSIRGNATSGEEPGSAGLLAARQEDFSNGFAVWLLAVKNRIALDAYNFIT